MVIQNKTNNKQLTVTKEQWDSFSRIIKNNHKILSDDDIEEAPKQMLKVEKMKTPPESGNKKTNSSSL